MDIAQSFGASSSYAKKYALGNLFLLDDTQDADTKDNRDANKEEWKKLSEKEIADLQKKLDEAHKDGNLKDEFFKLHPKTQEVLRDYANDLRTSQG